MEMLSPHWFQIQEVLFPHLQEKTGPMGSNHERLVAIIELSDIRAFINKIYHSRSGGRPWHDRIEIAVAFLAKHVFNLPTTCALIDRLRYDGVLRRLCGWERKDHIPSESKFSRVFKEFSTMNIMEALLNRIVTMYHGDRIIGHVRRDATEIDAREKATRKPKLTGKEGKAVPKKRGRPRKGEVRQVGDKEVKRLEKQPSQSLGEMLADLPTCCDIGSKVNSQGYKISWKGYKLHLDTIDGDIPVSAILTSASVHDSQVALPLSTMTEVKIKACYELMDSAYDAQTIRNHIAKKGHVPLIDFNRRSPKDERRFEDFEKERYKERSGAERANSNLKDNLGARTIRVRGHKKVFMHLCLGLVVMAVEQTVRLLM
jgi:hypothetical protein